MSKRALDDVLGEVEREAKRLRMDEGATTPYVPGMGLMHHEDHLPETLKAILLNLTPKELSMVTRTESRYSTREGRLFLDDVWHGLAMLEIASPFPPHTPYRCLVNWTRAFHVEVMPVRKAVHAKTATDDETARFVATLRFWEIAFMSCSRYVAMALVLLAEEFPIALLPTPTNDTIDGAFGQVMRFFSADDVNRWKWDAHYDFGVPFPSSIVLARGYTGALPDYMRFLVASVDARRDVITPALVMDRLWAARPATTDPASAIFLGPPLIGSTMIDIRVIPRGTKLRLFVGPRVQRNEDGEMFLRRPPMEMSTLEAHAVLQESIRVSPYSGPRVIFSRRNDNTPVFEASVKPYTWRCESSPSWAKPVTYLTMMIGANLLPTRLHLDAFISAVYPVPALFYAQFTERNYKRNKAIREELGFDSTIPKAPSTRPKRADLFENTCTDFDYFRSEEADERNMASFAAEVIFNHASSYDAFDLESQIGSPTPATSLVMLHTRLAFRSGNAVHFQSCALHAPAMMHVDPLAECLSCPDCHDDTTM